MTASTDVNVVVPMSSMGTTKSKCEYITIQRGETTKKIISCVEKTCAMQAFFAYFVKNMESLASNTSRAYWHQK